MFGRLKFVALALPFCTACMPTTGETLTQGTPVQLSASQKSAVQRGVRDVLKDPQSARFGMIAAAKDEDGVITVCGLVNARTSFGGYTGMTPYLGVLVSSGCAFAGMGGTETETQATLNVCRRKGVAI